MRSIGKFCCPGRVLFRRQFSFYDYGGENEALVAALAYRDTLIRLIPPALTHQVTHRLSKRNTSGVVGVHRINAGKDSAWNASYEGPDKRYAKKFRIAMHGEGGAKAKAMEWRQRFLDQSTQHYYTRDPLATERAMEQFGELGREAPPQMDQDTIKTLAAQLNAWFDALVPQFVRVWVRVSTKDARASLLLSIRGGQPHEQQTVRSWGLTKQTLQDVPQKAFDFIQAFVTSRCGVDWWRKFQVRYQAQIMAVNVDTDFRVRVRFVQEDAAMLLNPPGQLAIALQGYHVPTKLGL